MDTDFGFGSGSMAMIGTTNYGLYSQIALSTLVANTNVESSIVGVGIGTLSVPANTFKIGDSFIARMCGSMSSLNNANLTIKLKSNGIILATISLLGLAATTNKVWELNAHFTVSKIGGLGVAELQLNSTFVYNRQSNGEYIGANILEIDSTNFNTTILNTLDITATWGAASPTNSIQSQNFNLNKIF
jgi:hypothetical protein